MIRIAINGFGRIGRLTFRELQKSRVADVVAINDLTDNATLAHLLKYDSAQGMFDAKVKAGDDFIKVNSKKVASFSERDPSKLPWKKLKVDVVIEATGVFRTLDSAGKHLTAGAKKVVISAPAKGGGVKTIVQGINDGTLNKKDKIISNASCTTNCLAPMVKVLDDNFGIKSGVMTTIHAYTSDQRIQDAPHSDLRRARAAAVNIIPTSTGAASAIGLVLPHLQGKLDGFAMRVPVITGSIVDFTCIVNKTADTAKINRLFKTAASKHLKGFLQYSEEPLVSSDIIGNPHSCVFDAPLTIVTEDQVKVVGWYDNEAGYSNRLGDIAIKLAKVK